MLEHSRLYFDSLTREENLKQLIYYVISEPDIEEAKINQKKCYKFDYLTTESKHEYYRYPFTCADVLSSDCQAIVAEFFKTKQDLKEETALHKAEEAEDQDEVNIEGDSLDKDESTEASTVQGDKPTEESEKQSTPEATEFPYLDYLFSFLDKEDMNLTSAGYFAKVVNNLFTKKPSTVKV